MQYLIEDNSIFKLFSIGYVAENKRLDSHEVRIIPVEKLNLMDDSLGVGLLELVRSGVDIEENLYEEAVQLGATIPCEWIGRTNVRTSPDVRRGEQVYVYTKGDSNKYYWETVGRDQHLRRLETWRMEWSDIPENPDEDPESENHYYFEVSTHNGHITLQTVTRNGEVVPYTFQLNGRDGQATLTDDKQNTVQIDSAANTLHFHNEEGSLVEINRNEVHINGVEHIAETTVNKHVVADTIRFDCTNFHVNAATTRITGLTHLDQLKVTTISAGATYSGMFYGPIPVPSMLQLPDAVQCPVVPTPLTRKA